MIKEKYDQFLTYTQALIWYGFYQSIKGSFMFFKKFWRKKSNSDIQSVQDKSIAPDKISVAIQTFWTQVKASEQTFNTLEPISIMENLNNLLIDNQLNVIAELTRGDKKHHKIIFTAEGRIELFELVIRIVKNAPDLNFLK